MARMNHLLPATLVCGLLAQAASGEPLRVPFDFSRSEIAIAVAIKGAPAYVFVDSGVDPSTIDLARAKALHLDIGRDSGGEVSGTGSGKGPAGFPTTIKGLAIGGRAFGDVEAIATDLGPIAKGYGREVDAVLGFSFLDGKAVLIDYPARTLEILSGPADAKAETRSCRRQWSADLNLLPGENWPSFARFRLGAVSAPVTLDTGSNSWLMLYQGALGLPGLRAQLAGAGTARAAGFRGGETRKTYVFNAPIGFGPFAAPPGTPVTLNGGAGPGGVAANAGNKLFAALKLKLLLDYRARRMAFFGACT